MDRFNAFYFSFVTLSTVGFGDVTPVSKLARTLAVMEAVTGTFYVAILIARLVAMYVPASRSAAQDESRRP
jgi:voltage-gated potassium channel